MLYIAVECSLHTENALIRAGDDQCRVTRDYIVDTTLRPRVVLDKCPLLHLGFVSINHTHSTSHLADRHDWTKLITRPTLSTAEMPTSFYSVEAMRRSSS